MNYYVCDFETSVYDGQTDTEVWAAACVKIHTEDVLVVNSIDKYWEWIEQLKGKNIVYFHNGAFDFSYILDYLLKRDDYAQATYTPDGKVEHTMFYETNDMQPNTFKYSISDMGQWYTMTVKTHRSLIEFRDSYKLIPLSVADMGKALTQNTVRVRLNTRVNVTQGIILPLMKNIISKTTCLSLRKP